MKVTVSPDGSVSFDVDTPAQAAELALAVQSGRKAENAKAEKRAVAREVMSLTPKQRALYDALVEFDNPDGCHLSGLMELTGAPSTGAISTMCTKLIQRGLVTREGLQAGHYRAVVCANEIEGQES
jgi:hypothetical protein